MKNKLFNSIFLAAMVFLIIGCALQTTFPPEPSNDTNKTENITSEGKVRIDPQILEALKMQEWVYAHTVLNDSSGIDISKGATEEEKRNLLLEKYKINLAIQSEILNSLKPNEFVLKGSPSSAGYGFSGLISKEGLTKLSSDPRVIAIEKQFTVTEGDDEIK